MKGQEQTDNRISSRNHKKSNKKLLQIRIHIKTQKPNQIASQPRQRISFSRENSGSKEIDKGRVQTSVKSIRENQSSSLWESGNNRVRWRIGKANNAMTYMSGGLPQIVEGKRQGQGLGLGPKRAGASKSLKIQFRELVPIRQVSRQQRAQRLRVIGEQFREVVNSSNRIVVLNRQSVFRAYVQKGNNGVLVKELLKKRWWWHLQDQPSKANLIWTEWFNLRYTTSMPQSKTNDNHIKEQGFRESGGICYENFEPKQQSVRMIVDDQTFEKLRPRISIRDQHYLKRQNKTVQIRQQDNNIRQVTSLNSWMHNHIDGCLQLHSKKLLFKNMYTYLKNKDCDPFDFIPITYHIEDVQSTSYNQLLMHCDQLNGDELTKNLWIVKPGENSNRGFGISVHSGRKELQQELHKRLQNNGRGIIVQKYLQECFLIQGRKFDIRCYVLITTVNGCLKGYWYNDGYIRTSSQEYNLDDCENRMVHLTNDAIQKHNPSYGKYQDFNKMSFSNFKKYLTKLSLPSNNFPNALLQMKKIAYYLIASVSPKIKRKQYTFELFGLDFMLDKSLKPLLIQANSNPCLDTSGVILGKLIPQLIDNVLITAVDPLFPPPNKFRSKEHISKDYFRTNKFQLIFTDTHPSSPSQL